MGRERSCHLRWRWREMGRERHTEGERDPAIWDRDSLSFVPWAPSIFQPPSTFDYIRTHENLKGWNEIKAKIKRYPGSTDGAEQVDEPTCSEGIRLRIRPGEWKRQFDGERLINWLAKTPEQSHTCWEPRERRSSEWPRTGFICLRDNVCRRLISKVKKSTALH